MDHEPIVSFEKFRAASQVGKKEEWLKILAQRKSRIGELNRSRILAFIDGEGSVTAREIAEAVNLSKPGVRRHLRRLREEGLVEKIMPEKKYGSRGPLPFKWRIRTT
jgi:predicted ArsR family transcriptional regulator